MLAPQGPGFQEEGPAPGSGLPGTLGLQRVLRAPRPRPNTRLRGRPTASRLGRGTGIYVERT